MSDKQCRNFKGQVGGSNKYFGLYKGNTNQAASKAFTRICRDKKVGAGRKIKFSVTETTNGSAKKTYNYTGKRQKLKTPIIREIDGNKFTIKYKNIIVADK
jgi:hypothetical protein